MSYFTFFRLRPKSKYWKREWKRILFFFPFGIVVIIIVMVSPGKRKWKQYNQLPLPEAREERRCHPLWIKVYYTFTVREKGKKESLYYWTHFILLYFLLAAHIGRPPLLLQKVSLLSLSWFAWPAQAAYFREHPSQEKTRVVFYLLFFSHLLVKHHMPFRTVHYNPSWVQFNLLKSFLLCV